jgi:hypothetical protein
MLPMYVKRLKSNEEWDVWISNLIDYSSTELRSMWVGLTLDFSISEDEKFYVLSKLDRRIDELEMKELNEFGNLDEYFNDILEIVNYKKENYLIGNLAYIGIKIELARLLDKSKYDYLLEKLTQLSKDLLQEYSESLVTKK